MNKTKNILASFPPPQSRNYSKLKYPLIVLILFTVSFPWEAQSKSLAVKTQIWFLGWDSILCDFKVLESTLWTLLQIQKSISFWQTAQEGVTALAASFRWVKVSSYEDRNHPRCLDKVKSNRLWSQEVVFVQAEQKTPFLEMTHDLGSPPIGLPFPMVSALSGIYDYLCMLFCKGLYFDKFNLRNLTKLLLLFIILTLES